MNEKEIGEIKRRFRSDKTNITRVRGCYVNAEGKPDAYFDQSLGLMAEDESEKILSILKKTLSGTVGRNLLDISFSNNQVMDSDEHRLLMKLNDTKLDDNESVQKLFELIASSVKIDGNYMILLCADSYDVPTLSSDDNKSENGSRVFRYFLCGICPLKLTKAALGFFFSENCFRNIRTDWLLNPPVAGFMFPAFDGRMTNIYEALFYTRDTADDHEDLIRSVFNTDAPMPAKTQKDSFSALLRDSIAEECSYDVVKTVNDTINEMIEEHKASKDPDPLVLSKNTVKDILTSGGVTEKKVEEFGTMFDDTFGKHAEIPPKNLITGKQIEVRTPDISIRLNGEGSDRLETRVIDGQKYIMIRADGLVEVNGVEITISEEKV